MKKIILAAALAAASLTSFAGTVFTGTSKAGTIVNLNDTTSNRCSRMDTANDSWFYAEAQDRDGMVTLKGCWAAFDDKVQIHWMDEAGNTFTANWTWSGLRQTAYGTRLYGNGSANKQTGSQL